MPFERLQIILMCILLPLVTTATYLFFYTPDLRYSISGTGSNFAASGGYGPNQVATVLGMGMLILFTRLVTVKNRMINITDFLLLGFLSYRAIVTFSRGGVITAAVCAGLFLLFYLKIIPSKDRSTLVPKMFVITGVITLTWLITVFFSSGLIVNRYSNEDAAGKLKTDITTGRSEIIDTELAAFYENPITGVGVGKAKEYREKKTGIEAASHNETSRMLSEHGLFGLFGLLVLLLTPLLLRMKNRNNFFFYSFLAFWFLTINHSSMRIAAPAFIYGLSLINITYTKKA
jgi:O-antigen ligase